ncbi:Aste57867_22430 [Aphanomyces stellatus]|uniref:Aste57867_22430 protein n=1 Tax=Aphanomyces stellatus TaxID=120398 RepID=A0A485LK18_9STRA|nr:hypothetical protein As57867_022360 [Aphanomyces stellatus]VFT99092.1 Aste57867_22430 [Aphanomyces stellatus]
MSSTQIFVVDEATHEVQPVAEEAAVRLGMYNPQDVMLTVCLLCKLNLPTPIANKIAEMAGILSGFFEETHALVQDTAPMDHAYFRLVIPSDMGHGELEFTSCMGLSIECISHDQGWATDAPELNGTYDGCHSWMEYEVQDLDGVALLPRRVVCRNLRASWPFRRHRIEIRDRDVLDLLVPGHVVVLFARAQFGGWANFVKYACIHVALSVALKESVDGLQVLQSHWDELATKKTLAKGKRTNHTDEEGWATCCVS